LVTIAGKQQDIGGDHRAGVIVGEGH
jgi:hypothetical protein